MTRYLKALSFTLLAVYVFGTTTASSASASSGNIITCTNHATCDVTVEGTTTLGTKSSSLTVVCHTEKFSGTATSGAGLVTVTPTYENCTALGGNATIDTTGCHYRITGETTSHNKTTTGTEIDAPVDVICEGTNKIKVTGPACAISIGSQNGLHGVSYDKEGSGETDDVKITITLDSIHYTTSGFGCAIAGLPSTGTDGTITGSVTAKGYVDGGAHSTSEHVGLTYHEGEIPHPIEFHVEMSDTTLIGEGTGSEKFVVKAGTAECSESGYKGTTSKTTSTETTLSPEFAACTAFGFGNTEIKSNGCAYVLHAGNNESEKLEGSADIECSEGKVIEIIAKSRGILKCTVTIGAQTGLKTVTYTNEGAGSSRDVKVDFGLTGVKYTQDIGEGLGKCESGTFSNGEISGAPTVIGENAEKKQVGFWVE